MTKQDAENMIKALAELCRKRGSASHAIGLVVYDDWSGWIGKRDDSGAVGRWQDFSGPTEFAAIMQAEGMIEEA